MAITRIKANSGKSKSQKATEAKSKEDGTKVIKLKTKVEKAKIVKPLKPKKPKKGIFKLFAIIGDYFKNAVAELKQVHWPDRKSAWAMTGAVIFFTGFFVILIIILDYLFEMLFKIILK